MMSFKSRAQKYNNETKLSVEYNSIVIGASVYIGTKFPNYFRLSHLFIVYIAII